MNAAKYLRKRAEADREQAFIDAAELAELACVAAEVEAEIAAYQEIIDIMEGGEENDADTN